MSFSQTNLPFIYLFIFYRDVIFERIYYINKVTIAYFTKKYYFSKYLHLNAAVAQFPF